MARKKTTAKKGSKKARVPSLVKNDQAIVPVFLILWLALCEVVITFPSFFWLAPGGSYLPFRESWGVALFLFVLLFLCLKFLLKAPGQTLSAEVPAPLAWFFLLGSLALTAWLCLYRMDMPLGGYSQDSSFNLQIRHWKDLSDYRNILVSERGLLPAWPYLGCFLWDLFPDASGLWIQRLTGALFDLGTVLALYMAGKEMGGRRLGVMTAILAALSKPFLSRVVSGYGSTSLVFGLALVLWLTLRLAHKKGIFDFLVWGVGVGFLAYTSAPVEPFIPFFIFMGLILTFVSNPKEMKLTQVPVFIWVSLALLLPFYLCCLNAFPDSAGILRLVKSGEGFIFVAVLACSGSLLAKVIPGYGRDPWTKWFLGAWTATIVSFSGMTSDFILERIVGHSLVSGVGFLSPVYLWASFKRLPDTLQWLFWACTDRPDMGMSGDALFSYIETVLILLGLVFCFARPSWIRIFLLLTAAVGILPHFFAESTHSGLLIGCSVPLVLVAAMGLNEMVTLLFAHLTRSTLSRSLVYVALLLLAGWSARMVFLRIYPQWAEIAGGVVLPREQIFKNAREGHRVYISKGIFDSSAVLYEGIEVHLWHQYNPLVLATNEVAPTVDIYVTNVEGDITKALHQAFPQAKWESVSYSTQPDVTQFWHCILSPEQLKPGNKGLLYLTRLPKPYWERTYMAQDTALNLSMVNWEDGATDIYAPLPAEAQVVLGNETVKIEGDIEMAHAGDFQIECKTHNRAKVWIDGVKIFDISFFKIGSYAPGPADKKAMANLAAGPHHVKVVTSFQEDSKYPDITLRSTSGAGEGQSLWKTFKFN